MDGTETNEIERLREPFLSASDCERTPVKALIKTTPIEIWPLPCFTFHIPNQDVWGILVLRSPLGLSQGVLLPPEGQRPGHGRRGPGGAGCAALGVPE